MQVDTEMASPHKNKKIEYNLVGSEETWLYLTLIGFWTDSRNTVGSVISENVGNI